MPRTFNKIIKQLFAMKYSSKPDLAVMQLLSKAWHYPHLSFNTIHIAGTNGKGSVSLKIAKALELAGYKVGLYTSPHLFSFCERIRIGDEMISEEEVIVGLKRLFSLVYLLKVTPSFFELATLLAFDFFRQRKVDVAVIETGLGGRLDATNVIEPLISIITSISKEHTEILGESVAEIAQEKAGILKPGIPIVLGPHAHHPVIIAKAESVQCPVHVVEGSFPFYDLENKATSLKALKILKTSFSSLSDEAIEQGIQVRPPCRFESFHGAIFDVAHNPDGYKRLMEALTFHFPDKSFRFVIGMCEDKDIRECLKVVVSKACHIHFVAADRPRAASVAVLYAHLKETGSVTCTLAPSIFEGVAGACEQTNASNEILVICGSFYIMEEAKQTLAASLVVK